MQSSVAAQPGLMPVHNTLHARLPLVLLPAGSGRRCTAEGGNLHHWRLPQVWRFAPFLSMLYFAQY
jgi:hypothetical protein